VRRNCWLPMAFSRGAAMLTQVGLSSWKQTHQGFTPEYVFPDQLRPFASFVPPVAAKFDQHGRIWVRLATAAEWSVWWCILLRSSVEVNSCSLFGFDNRKGLLRVHNNSVINIRDRITIETDWRIMLPRIFIGIDLLCSLGWAHWREMFLCRLQMALTFVYHQERPRSIQPLIHEPDSHFQQIGEYCFH
jgi:hypothetical protein